MNEFIMNLFFFFLLSIDILLKIISEEKDPIDDREFQNIEEELNIQQKLPNIPLIDNDKNIMTVPLSSVAVWIDPLDATKEFTGIEIIS